MKKVDISILIPFLNEEENVAHLIKSLLKFIEENPTIIFEIILIDDGSTDLSIKKLLEIIASDFKIIQLSKNFGSHAALRAGISQATGEWITFMYADLQDPLSLILSLYEKCSKENNEISWAVRNQPQGTFSELYAKLMQKYATSNFPKNGFDIVMFSKKVQQYLNLNIEANSSIFLQVLTLGFKQTTIFYQKEDRKAGKSKWTISKKIKLLIDSFVAFSFFPIRLVSYVGILMFLLGVVFSIYLIFRKLYFNDLEQGWTTLISVLLIGFGVTNISLGIIAEYLWRTLDASRKRPVFVIDKIHNFEC